MTPIAQVGHILRKDLREHRVRVALFVVLVLVALARAMGAPLPVAQNALSILVLFAGIAIVAAPVESDPPADVRSFWPARPVSPSAMFAAKVGFAMLLVLVAGLAQAMALWSLDLRLAEAMVYLTGPLQLFGLLLVATLVVAGASGDARARLLLVFALLLGLLFALGKMSKADPVSPMVKEASIALVALLMLGALFASYRTRRGGFVPVVTAFVILVLGGAAMVVRTTPVVVPPVGPDVPRPVIRMEVPPGTPAVYRGHLRVRLSAAQAPAGWQYSLQAPLVVVTLGSGRVLQIRADQNFMNLGGDPGPMPLPSATSAMRDPGEPTGWREVSIPLSPEARTAEGDTIRQVRLSGTVLVTQLRVVDTIPLGEGLSRARNGIRTIIDSVTAMDGGLEVVLRAEGLTRPEDQSRLFPFTSYFGRAYVLLGQAGDRVAMRQTWTASSSVGLVLPTSAFGDARLRLAPIDTGAASRNAPGAVSADGISGARLLAIEPRLQGSYPIALEWRRGG